MESWNFTMTNLYILLIYSVEYMDPHGKIYYQNQWNPLLSYSGILNTEEICKIYWRKLYVLLKKSVKFTDSVCRLGRSIIEKSNFYMMLQNSKWFYWKRKASCTFSHFIILFTASNIFSASSGIRTLTSFISHFLPLSPAP